MDYRIIVTDRARKDIYDLDRIIRKKIYQKLKYLARSPIKLSRRLINSRIGQYRYRVGNYRIIFDIDKNNIVILRIGHRKDIYR